VVVFIIVHVAMRPSSNILHLTLAVLLGVYAGINLSGLHQLPSPQLDDPSSAPRKQVSTSSDKENERQLKKFRTESEEWRTKAEKYEKNYTLLVNKFHDLQVSCSQQVERMNPGDRQEQHQSKGSSIPRSNPHPFCQSAFSKPTPSAMALWMQHLSKILEATRVPADHKWQFHDFTARLLQIISPRLPRSVKTTPYDWRPVGQALTIAWERYQYLQMPIATRRNVNNPPRPLKVLIMGGSLLVGTNCRMLMTELNFQFRLPKRECTWAYRVEEFLNAIFDAPESEPLVQVTKVAMGGTNTATGSIIWQYSLIPPEARNPDIVLNAYSTNDMHILTILEAQSSNTTLRDRTFDMIQSFVRQILQTQQCPDNHKTGPQDDWAGNSEPLPPLLLHMDDYLGNEQRKIWDSTELAQGVQVLASYYGFVTMSYSDVVRDIVYGDSYESWFSSDWWKKAKNIVSFEREIHPGMGMHIASTWVTVYNLLHLASGFCSLPDPYRPQSIPDYEPGLWGLPELKKTEKEPKGKPHSKPMGLPPVLTKDLLLEDVTSLWRRDAKKAEPSISCYFPDHYSDVMDPSSQSLRVECPFSWVSGLSLQQNNVTWVKDYFQRQSSTWNGWQLSDDKDKIGFVPIPGKSRNEKSARMVLDFDFPQIIRSITFFYMKSYGPTWKNSHLKAKIWLLNGTGGEILLEERYLMGVHNKTTSEMYTEEIRLKNSVSAREKFQVEATLMEGGMFKIMGLAVCS
jgi:hypothetical protein